MAPAGGSLPAVPILSEPILLAPRVGFVMLLSIFVNPVAPELGVRHVRFGSVGLVSFTSPKLFAISFARLVAVFALGMLLSARLVVALILH